jgi:hypothetical protein
MAAYWWECEGCGKSVDFPNATGAGGITRFIRDILLPSDWDQSLLLRQCTACDKPLLRMTYEFPRGKETVSLHTVHIVGLDKDEYLPMMWETCPMDSPQERWLSEERWFDFKYINKSSIFGLNKPAVFLQDELRRLFDLYRTKTGVTNFP